jgi:hypothetical protein
MVPSASEYGLIMGIVGGFSSLATFIVEIVFIVVVATLVRRERPDAWAIFAGSFACDILALLFSTLGTMAVSFLASTSGSLYPIAAVSLFAGLLHVVGRALIVVGVVRLARQPAEKPPWP